MSEFGATIRRQWEPVENENQLLTSQLAALDTALEGLVCYSEVYADLASAAGIAQTGRWLSGWLPAHFVREERTLAKAATLGADWAAFGAEMARQHREIAERVQRLCQAAGALEQSRDLEESIGALKQTGLELTRFMTAHMGAEERKLHSLNA